MRGWCWGYFWGVCGPLMYVLILMKDGRDKRKAGKADSKKNWSEVEREAATSSSSRRKDHHYHY